MLFVCEQVPFSLLCKPIGSFLFFQATGEDYPWNLLRARGHSVLSLTLVLLRLQPVTACLVPLRELWMGVWIFLTMTRGLLGLIRRRRSLM
ncbi:hypothetical protein GLYMA_18G192450v4 [Glycine max]|nr:hypothetical protein GLYMA_18G192450v4 [Glycine max]KAH1155171.1 hypothetical protein GYH30_050475 [Glycine max]